MQRTERSVTEFLRAYIEEEAVEPRRIDVDEAIEAAQVVDPSLRRHKKKPLQSLFEDVLIKLQKEHVKNAAMMDVSQRDLNNMNQSVIGMWQTPQKPEDEAEDSHESAEKTERTEKTKPKGKPEKKKRKKAQAPEGEEEAKDESKNHRPASSVKLSDLGGIDNVVTQILELLAMPLSHPEIFIQLGSDIPRGVLLHGPPGCGKTMLANAVANELGCAFLSISAPAVVSGMSGESEKKLRELFEEAKQVAPCLVFIDEIDAITPKRENAQREMERRIVAQLLTCMDDVALDKTGGRPVMIIGATNRPDSIDPALRRGGRFDHEICMSVPDQDARQRILEALAKKLKVDGDLDFKELARRTPGYVGADLNALVAAAGVAAIKRIFQELQQQESMQNLDVQSDNDMVDDSEAAAPNKTSVVPKPNESADQPEQADIAEAETARPVSIVKRFLDRHPDPLSEEELAPLSIKFEDFVMALPQVQPSSKREGFATVPDVTWKDVGAMKPIREELEYAVVAPIKQPEIYAKAGITAPSGVLLWGPPGCGKTLLAKAVANESQANFISVRGPELLNKYVGESERAVRQVFVRARASVPCVIFFDELDALVPRRDDSQSEASSRVVNTLLTELDGTGDRHGVFVVAATNRPDMIDQAMLRPGRLDKQLFVELPSAGERVDILVTICQKSKTPLSPSVDLVAVAHDERCRNFSGADLAALAREAAVLALRRTLNNKSGGVDVTSEDFQNAFDKVRPSVNDAERQKYYAMKDTLAS